MDAELRRQQRFPHGCVTNGLCTNSIKQKFTGFMASCTDEHI